MCRVLGGDMLHMNVFEISLVGMQVHDLYHDTEYKVLVAYSKQSKPRSELPSLRDYNTYLTTLNDQ